MGVALPLSILVTACGSSGSTGSETGTLTGTVLSAPSCPVERAGSPCPPRPVPGPDVTVLRGSAAAAHVRGDASGHFSVRVNAGNYTVVARAVGGIGSSASAAVTVVAGQTATVTLTVDSGIR
jgi:hypothetical protein